MNNLTENNSLLKDDFISRLEVFIIFFKLTFIKLSNKFKIGFGIGNA